MKILLTGGSSGIGLSLLKKILKEFKYPKVFLITRYGKKTYISNGFTKNQLSKIVFIKTDLTSIKNIKKVLKILIGTKFDILINNAGGFIEQKKNGRSSINRMLILNTFAPYLISKTLLKKNKYLQIINISSFLQLIIKKRDLYDLDLIQQNKSYYKVYALSKFLLNLTSFYLKKKFIKANILCVNPGIIRSNFGIQNNSILRKIISLLRNIIGKNPDTFSSLLIKYIKKNKKTNLDLRSNSLVFNINLARKIISKIDKITQ